MLTGPGRTDNRIEKDHYDVVVVGARCAGAATAMLLARAGHDVLLLDRAALPSDTTSTHALSRGGVVQLHRWGLLDRVLDTGAPAIRSVGFHRYDSAAPREVWRGIKDRAGVDLLIAPRRHVLDAVLADAAVAAGAELQTRTTLSALLDDGAGRVTGVVACGPDGEQRPVRARLVVGADGVRSRTARLVGSRMLESYDPAGACLYTYVDGVSWDGFEFHLGRDTFAGVFPTHRGQANVWLIQPAAVAEPVLAAGADRTAAWLQALRETVPGLAERVAHGRVDEPLRGSVGLPNHVRQATGPGWALVGDAAYHRDPITGHGITDAFRDAELLAHAANLALLEPGHEASAFDGYEERRLAALQPSFRLTRALGAFPDADRFTELQVELSQVLEAEALELAALPDLAAVGVC